MKRNKLILSVSISILISLLAYEAYSSYKFNKEDFEIIIKADASIAEMIKNYSKKTEIESLRNNVERGGNTLEGSLLLSNVREADGFIDSTIHLMHQIRASSITKAGGLDDSLKIIGYDQKHSFDKKQIENLKRKLDSSIVIINKKVQSSYSAITLSPDEKPLNEITFWETYFKDAPLIVALYTLRRLELQILALKNESVRNLAKKVKGDDKFQKIKPIVQAKSDEVYEGETYEATVGLLYYEPISEGDVKVTEGEISDNKDGSCKLSLVAKADKFDKDGKARKKLTVSVHYSYPNGDTVFQTETEYFVKRKQSLK